MRRGTGETAHWKRHVWTGDRSVFAKPVTTIFNGTVRHRAAKILSAIHSTKPQLDGATRRSSFVVSIEIGVRREGDGTVLHAASRTLNGSSQNTSSCFDDSYSVVFTRHRWILVLTWRNDVPSYLQHLPKKVTVWHLGVLRQQVRGVGLPVRTTGNVRPKPNARKQFIRLRPLDARNSGGS